MARDNHDALWDEYERVQAREGLLREIAIAIAIVVAGALVAAALAVGLPNPRPQPYDFHVVDGIVYIHDQRSGRVLECARAAENAPAPNCKEVVGRITAAGAQF